MEAALSYEGKVRGYSTGLVPCVVFLHTEQDWLRVLKPLPIDNDEVALTFLRAFLPTSLKHEAILFIVAQFYGVENWLKRQLGEKMAHSLQHFDILREQDEAVAVHLVHSGSGVLQNLPKPEPPAIIPIGKIVSAYVVGLPFIIFGTTERTRLMIESLVASFDREGVKAQKALMSYGLNTLVFPPATDEWLSRRLSEMRKEITKMEKRRLQRDKCLPPEGR